MAKPEVHKKMSVHFEESLGIDDLSTDPGCASQEEQFQLKDITSSSRKHSYRLSQVVMRRKKPNFNDTKIIVTAILFTIAVMLGIVGWLVFSEHSTIRTTRTPFDNSPTGRQYGSQ